MKRKAILGQVSDIDIRLLRVFRVVVESGGMSAAELELNISVSTISRYIKDLESRLGGLTLCHRGRGGFSLTDEGKEVYTATLRLLGAMESFQVRIHDIHQHLTGTLTLAFFDKTVTNPGSELHTALGLFAKRAPEVDIAIYVENVNNIESGILDDQYDLGIVPMHRASTVLQYYSLFSEAMYMYCGAGHSMFASPGDDQNDELILSQPYAGLGYHSPNMDATHSLKLTRKATAYDQEAITTLIRSGRFLAFLPDHYAKTFVEQNQIRRIENPRFHYKVDYSAIIRRSPEPSRMLQAFVDCLIESHGQKKPR